MRVAATSLSALSVQQVAPCVHPVATCAEAAAAGAHAPACLSSRRRSRSAPGHPVGAQRHVYRVQRCNAQMGGMYGAQAGLEQLTAQDLRHLYRAAEVSQAPLGQTQPHPYAGCVLVNREGLPLAEASHWAQGTEPPECQVARQAGGAARGGTAYVNLESGDCHGDRAAIDALVGGGVARVVVGLRHPLPHLRGVAITALREAGIAVVVLGEAPSAPCVGKEAVEAALDACLAGNEALLHRAVTRRPMGLLKYAMTLDGKIATHTGHSAWVSSPQSRQQVFEMRARSDAVIVGGCTVRRDNPQLTTRRDGGHQPMRVVMSRTLDLPAEAKLWDVSHAPTIVATQRGARLDFQRMLRERGVEVLQFDFLTPDAVARYCYDRGFLQCLWECGGMLAAPAIATGAIHKTMAFVAPKLIGGTRAPTPVGDLGFVEMTQALQLEEVRWRQVGPDLMLTGYLPQSGGLRALAAAAAEAGANTGPSSNSSRNKSSGMAAAGGGTSGVLSAGSSGSRNERGLRHPGSRLAPAGVAEFYKVWDRYGCFSNFSPHSISMPEGAMTRERAQELHQQQQWQRQGVEGDSKQGQLHCWASAEHYYQSQKFAGMAHPEAQELVAAIATARSPEEAAELGRRAEQARGDLLRPDWAASKVSVMLAALRTKFAKHAGPRQVLLATALNCGGRGCSVGHQGAASGSSSNGSQLGLEIVEASPNDFFWGRGYNGTGNNMLGKLLMQVREELEVEQQQQQQQQAPPPAARQGHAAQQQQRQQAPPPAARQGHAAQQQQRQQAPPPAARQGHAAQQQAKQQPEQQQQQQQPPLAAAQ